jgi:hypothetical protein
MLRQSVSWDDVAAVAVEAPHGELRECERTCDWDE